MMKYLRWIILGLVAAAALLWLKGCFDPSPKVQINRQLKKLSSLASFEANEPSFKRFTKIERMGALFSEDIVVLLDSAETDTHELRGRNEVMQFAMGAKMVGNGMKVEFIDINIDLAPGNQTAKVDLTLKAHFGTDADFIPQELAFSMAKTNGEWLINRVESVKPLKP